MYLTTNCSIERFVICKVDIRNQSLLIARAPRLFGHWTDDMQWHRLRWSVCWITKSMSTIAWPAAGLC